LLPRLPSYAAVDVAGEYCKANHIRCSSSDVAVAVAAAAAVSGPYYTDSAVAEAWKTKASGLGTWIQALTIRSSAGVAEAWVAAGSRFAPGMRLIQH